MTALLAKQQLSLRGAGDILSRWLLILSMSAMIAAPASSASSAVDHSAVYSELSPSLFVIESVAVSSGNKNSVGSGFALRDGVLLATNYHVVSSAFLNPEQYTLRAVAQGGDSLELAIVVVDPVHDLALLRPAELPTTATLRRAGLVVAEAEPQVGDAVLALGNPLDIGLSLVPGTYNGVVAKAYRPRIHFTGALNPGMSGGPAVNAAGEVVGINVAGTQNSVGLLVPANKLLRLLARADLAEEVSPYDAAAFGRQVREHQDALVDDLISGDWEAREFGPLMIPGAVRPYVNCTGAASETEDDTRWSQSISNCVVEDRIFLSRRLNSGPVEMFFSVYETEELSPFQFASVFSDNLFFPANTGPDQDLTDFECTERWTRLPNLGEQAFKATLCLRAYLDFADMYDVLYVARGMRGGRQAIDVHYTLSGVGREAAQKFQTKLLGAIRWK